MRIRLPALLAASGAAILTFSSPAEAALVVNSDGSITVSGTGGGAANTTTITYNGLVDGTTVNALSASMTLVFNGFGPGNTANFGYTLNNTSSSPLTGSRVSVFGFNTTPDLAIVSGNTSATATGAFAGPSTGPGNTPGLPFNPEVCFGGNNCAGGGNGGVSLGGSGSGTFTLNLTSAPTSLTLSNFFVRYQSINGGGFNGASGVGVGTAVPEPGTWGMMLLGFAAVGFAMRRSRKVRAQLKGGLPQLA